MNDEKKKVKQAVALEYDPSDEAPRVIARHISRTAEFEHFGKQSRNGSVSK